MAEQIELQELVPRRHADLLEAWMNRPHVLRWWGEQARTLPTLLRRLPDTHALIVANGNPVGYLCWGPPEPEELTAAGLTDLPEAIVDIDILIGEPLFVGRGIGPRALRLLLDQLRRKNDVRWAGLGTSLSNHAAISAFEKAGFRLFRDFDDPELGPCRYLVFDLGPGV